MSLSPESRLTLKIKEYLREQGALCFKYHADQYSQVGHPDLYGVLSYPACLRGKFFAFEVKVPGEKPRPNQLAMLEMIEEYGGLSAWVCSVDEVEHWLNEWAKAA
jgi:hypothetical protein